MHELVEEAGEKSMKMHVGVSMKPNGQHQGEAVEDDASVSMQSV